MENENGPISVSKHMEAVKRSDVEEKRDLIVEEVCQRFLKEDYDPVYVELFRKSTFQISDIKQYQIREFSESASAASDAYNRLFNVLLSMGAVEDSRMKYIAHGSPDAALPLALLTEVDMSTLPGVQKEIVAGYLHARLVGITDKETHEITFEELL